MTEMEPLLPIASMTQEQKQAIELLYDSVNDITTEILKNRRDKLFKEVLKVAFDEITEEHMSKVEKSIDEEKRKKEFFEAISHLEKPNMNHVLYPFYKSDSDKLS